MDLLITGASGFLGSHTLLEWLHRYPESRALCLVRCSIEETAVERVKKGLKISAYEAGIDLHVNDLLKRVTVVDASIENSEWNNHPEFLQWIQRSSGFGVIHGAANLSFRDEDREIVWKTNVEGTASFFRRLAKFDNICDFNYVSTAYVVGNKEGSILENEDERPSRFNNVYEESKWVAERFVRDFGRESKIGVRIFRPSIIIGHSKTNRMTSKTGFYKVIETLIELKLLKPKHSSPITIPVKQQASLNLIPIDMVVFEMLDIIAVGEASIGKAYHLTNERPVSIADIFFGVTPLTGLTLACETETCDFQADKTAALVKRGLRHYLPYFSYVRTFERGNVYSCGAGRQQKNYWLDIVKLRKFVTTFMETRKSYKPALALGVNK